MERLRVYELVGRGRRLLPYIPIMSLQLFRNHFAQEASNASIGQETEFSDFRTLRSRNPYVVLAKFFFTLTIHRDPSGPFEYSTPPIFVQFEAPSASVLLAHRALWSVLPLERYCDYCGNHVHVHIPDDGRVRRSELFDTFEDYRDLLIALSKVFAPLIYARRAGETFYSRPSAERYADPYLVLDDHWSFISLNNRKPLYTFEFRLPERHFSYAYPYYYAALRLIVQSDPGPARDMVDAMAPYVYATSLYKVRVGDLVKYLEAARAVCAKYLPKAVCMLMDVEDREIKPPRLKLDYTIRFGVDRDGRITMWRDCIYTNTVGDSVWFDVEMPYQKYVAKMMQEIYIHSKYSGCRFYECELPYMTLTSRVARKYIRELQKQQSAV